MTYDLTGLINGYQNIIEIDNYISYQKSELENVSILDLIDTKIKGSISKTSVGDINVKFDINGIMLLTCDITLNPTKYSFRVTYNESINELSSINEYIKSKVLDLEPIVGELIVLERPSKVISDEAIDTEFCGDGWRLVTDDTPMEKISELSKLKELLEDKEA